MNEELANCSRGRVLWLLFWNFFKIALFVVGGGFAIILAAEESFVKRLRWLKEGELLDMLTVIQSVPGLTAGNAAIYVGYRAAGHAGALIALFGVALPSFTVITLLSMGLDFLPLDNLYLQSAFIGVRTAMAGLMIATVARLWRKIMSGFFPWFVMLACFLLMTFTKVNPGWLIAGSMAAGIASAFMPVRPGRRAEESRGVATLLLLFVLFVYFGLLCFGGGAVLVNFYIHELVELRHWLTLDELADMVAISQVTPGPIGVNIATFIGYRQGGIPGAAIATIGLLFPSYWLMMGGLKSLDKWEHSRIVGGIMAGIRPATIGLMITVTLVYLEMSLFTAAVPWRGIVDWTAGNSADFGGFGLRLLMLPVLAVSTWALYKSKCSIMAAIFTSAAAGALCAPWL